MLHLLSMMKSVQIKNLKHVNHLVIRKKNFLMENHFKKYVKYSIDFFSYLIILNSNLFYLIQRYYEKKIFRVVTMLYLKILISHEYQQQHHHHINKKNLLKIVMKNKSIMSIFLIYQLVERNFDRVFFLYII